MHSQFGPFLIAQKFLVYHWEGKGRFSKLKDLPALDHLAVSSASSGALFRAHPSTWGIIVFDENAGWIGHHSTVRFLSRAALTSWFPRWPCIPAASASCSNPSPRDPHPPGSFHAKSPCA